MNQKQANDLIALLNYRDATIATLTAALEEARGALEKIEAKYAVVMKEPPEYTNFTADELMLIREAWYGASLIARTALATINAALGRVEK